MLFFDNIVVVPSLIASYRAKASQNHLCGAFVCLASSEITIQRSVELESLGTLQVLEVAGLHF